MGRFLDYIAKLPPIQRGELEAYLTSDNADDNIRQVDAIRLGRLFHVPGRSIMTLRKALS